MAEPDTKTKNTAPRGRCPYENANLLSRVTFWWLNPLFRLGKKQTLTPDDLYDGLACDQATVLVDKLERTWATEIAESKSSNKKPNLLKAVVYAFKWKCLVIGIFLFVAECMRLLQPFLIGELIGFFQPNTQLSTSEAYCIGAALGVSGVIVLICDPWYYFQTHYIARRMKTAVGCLIYRKILKISSISLHQTGSGRIINHLSTDLETFNLAAEALHVPWDVVLSVSIISVMVYRNVGVAYLPILPIVACVIPIQIMMGKLFGKLRKKIAARTDKRIHTMNEIISGMRVIKMYCWEKPFSRVIKQLRRSEIQQIWYASIARTVNYCLYVISPCMLNLSIFVSVWLMEIPINASIVFSTIGWIEILKISLFYNLSMSIEYIIQLWTSLNRIRDFLLLEEIPMPNSKRGITYEPDSSSTEAISITNFTAKWMSTNQQEESSTYGPGFFLKDLNLLVKRGELIAVCGTVGCGKSSLLLALLGELPATKGSVAIRGKVGYVSQQAWIISGTVMENIVFGLPFDLDKYNRVIHACALDTDIGQMSHGDQTLVGERGLLLSGGQKARLALARTIYKDADIILLDDPLGAVDAEVGNHLFHKCILGYLAGKTRILVTHQVQYLQFVERIVTMEEGMIVNVGSFDEVDISIALKEESTALTDTEKVISKVESKPVEVIEEEDLESGSVTWRVYAGYISSAYPKFTVPTLLILVTLTQFSFVVGDWHLALWSDHHTTLQRTESEEKTVTDSAYHCNVTQSCTSLSKNNLTMTNDSTSHLSTIKSVDDYIYIYIIAECLFVVLNLVMSLLFTTTLTVAGKRLHDKMFRKVINTKTRFFDSNPVGRVLNRFARDMGFMDDYIPKTALTVFEMGFRVAGYLLATCVINPMLFIPLCPLILSIIFIRNYGVKTTRQMKRIEAVTRSPIYSHLSDTLNGLQTIRSLSMEQKFNKDFEKYVNRHTLAEFLFVGSYRWISTRSLFAVCIFTIIVIILSLVLKDVSGTTGALYGLSLNYLVVVADPFEYLTRMTAELENYMTSVERITAYTRLEDEGVTESQNPPQASWPADGSIMFANVCLRYSQKSPEVLKNITCSISGKEKIGIVGRTGAGKSSLLAALLRLAEPTGEIYIDGINILQIGLHELRRKISVIPQDPILFSNTMRYNLDPFEEFTDDQIWGALEQVQLKTKMESLPGTLYAEMTEGGQNFSVGQRQLVCLARAILHVNRILILDEATANVDRRTDEMIQTTIREQFRDCTVLTVAHRLQTIMDSDKIMVLDEGQLKEFDTPANLLQIKHGYFRKLVDESEHLADSCHK